jgi:DegV family protein with EDD domain
MTPPDSPRVAASVAVVTDSTACIPPDVAAQHDIEIVPVHIIVGGRTYADSLTTDTSEFYEILRSATERPTTAAPSPGMYVEAIGRAARRPGVEAVLIITVSKQFSAMYDSAGAAIQAVRAESPSLDLRLFDSRNAAMAQGFIVLEAARAAARGASIDDVIKRAEAMTSQVALLAMLDTLSYLARSGRVPRVAAWAAGMLQVKPIVRFSASDIKLVARTRTRGRALDRMATLFAGLTTDRGVHLAVHHANAPADAQALLEAATRSTEVVESYVTEFTQVMGVHTGPGLVGMAWWCE